jgi:hypothetical protein
LEGWEVRESQYSKAIEARGEHKGALKGARAYLLMGFQFTLQSPPPEAIRQVIEGTNDLATLDRWFSYLFSVNSWEELQNRMKQP